jgi:FeS assembly SUF system regulator
MLKVNKLTDYATVVLIEIARTNVVRSSQHLSDRTGIPLPTVAKLMKSLNKGGLVVSQRGAGGGYVMGRNPHHITIADIIQAVEGPIALTACADTSEEQCGLEAVCPVHGKWNRVNAAVRAALSEVTLADMADDVATFGQKTRVLAAVAAPRELDVK